MRRESRIRERHLERLAVVYVRQSTAQQVLTNTESARLQYGLREQARDWGWPEERIETIDEDQGVSGSGDQERRGFARLTMMVAQKQVGVVLGLDSSRLARNTADWFQLLRWLRLTDSLFAKEGKVYDLKEGDSRIVLGIEGTLSEEGRFQIRARLDAGLESKAERGELYRRVASGYVLDGGQLRKDPDERVRHAIGEVFASFRETGSARQAVQRLRAAGRQLPGGREPGRAEWKEATYSRVHQILTNPLMGGAYVYGRRRTEVSLGKRGEVRKQVVRVPQEEWGVLLEGRHEGYVSWEEWQAVQRRLAENSVQLGSGAPREGRALLQRLAVCGVCGRRMQAQYGTGVRYLCSAKDSGTGERGCQSVGGARVEEWVTNRFLEAAGMGGVEAALRAEREARAREAGRLRSYELDLERCEYEARQAGRRYRAEDPDNRLVMRTLARDWETALSAVERARRELERAREAAPPQRDPEVSAELFAGLGARVRRLWESPEVEMRDRKRLLATLVEEVVLRVDREAGCLHVLLRWRGGWIDESELALPQRFRPERDSDETVERVRRLAELYPDARIAETLNAQGWRSTSGQRFTRKLVTGLRHRHGIAVFGRDGRDRDDSGVALLSVSEAARELGTSAGTLYRWIRQGFVPVEVAGLGEPMQVRLDADVRERFCEAPPEGYVLAAQARRELGLSRQTLWERIREGMLEARRIVRGPDKGLYVKWDREDGQLPLLAEESEESVA